MISSKECIELMKNGEDARISDALQKIEDGIKKSCRVGFNSYFHVIKGHDNDLDTIKNKLIKQGFSLHETIDCDGDVVIVISWITTDHLKKKLEICDSRFKKEAQSASGGLARLLGS